MIYFFQNLSLSKSLFPKLAEAFFPFLRQYIRVPPRIPTESKPSAIVGIIPLLRFVLSEELFSPKSLIPKAFKCALEELPTSGMPKLFTPALELTPTPGIPQAFHPALE